MKEKRLVKRALCNLDVNRLVSRQGSIIDISFCLSTGREKFLEARPNAAGDSQDALKLA
jgi:hypothetical protein